MKKADKEIVTTFPKKWKPLFWRIWLWCGPFATEFTRNSKHTLIPMTGIFDRTLIPHHTNMVTRTSYLYVLSTHSYTLMIVSFFKFHLVQMACY